MSPDENRDTTAAVNIVKEHLNIHPLSEAGTPHAMTSPPFGSGSVYAMTARGINGGSLDGSKTHSVDLPASISAANFWSFMMYSCQTRSMLETDQ